MSEDEECIKAKVFDDVPWGNLEEELERFYLEIKSDSYWSSRRWVPDWY